MAGTLMHMQYNSPLPLYSKEAAEEELSRATNQPSPRPAPEPGQLDLERRSGAYKLLHSGGQLPPDHSVRLDEPVSNDYPHYKGYVDPNLQSPSFKRLQHFAGLDESGTTGNDIATGQRPATPQKSPVPQYYPDQPPVAQRDPASADERDHPLDPNFAQKIADAERPKVPPPVVPSWAKKAHVKQHRWEEYSAAYQQQPPTSEPVQQQWQQATAPPAPPPPPSAARPFQPVPVAPPPVMNPTPAQFKTVAGPTQAEDKWQHHYSSYGMETGGAGPRSPGRRPRSVEPDSWRARPSGREPMMKPFVAPNVLHAKFGQTTESYRSPQPPRPASQLAEPTFGGIYYGPPGAGYSTTRSTATSYRKHDEFGQPTRPQDFGSSYERPKQINIESMVSGPAEPPAPYWTQKAEQSRRQWQSTYGSGGGGAAALPPSSAPSWRTPGGGGVAAGEPLFRSESEAWRRKQEMEQEARRRAADVGSAPRPPSGARGGNVEPITQKWHDASGARTKSQTQGSYLDEKGNVVNYVKEVYTSSDPGTEFSMLTQEEKKALEEPLEAGVVSRHVTSKYYKKSTYTNQTTSTTDPQPVSYPTSFHYQRPGPSTTSATGQGVYRVGEVAPGLSQF